MTNRVQFDVNEIMRAVDREVLDQATDLALTISRNIINGCPVGMPDRWQRPPPPGYQPGKAKANWHVTIGTVSDEQFDIRDPGGGATLKKIIDVLETYTDATQSLVIQNNLPYIVPLENGHSFQAPQGFVRGAIAAASADPIDRRRI